MTRLWLKAATFIGLGALAEIVCHRLGRLKPAARNPAEEKTDERLDAMLEDSFPASDPPSFPGVDI